MGDNPGRGNGAQTGTENDVVDGGRTIYAERPDDVFAVMERMERNDEDCKTVVLTLAPPYQPIAERLAVAIKATSVLTSLKLVLEPESDLNEITRPGGAVDIAVKTNSSITALDVRGAPIPKEWPLICCRNSCLHLAAPEPIQLSDPDQEEVDLTQVPWAFPENGQFSDLAMRDPIARGGMGAVFKVKVNGVEVAAKAPFTLIEPELFGLREDPVARRVVLKDCMRELSALRRLNGHTNIVGFRCVVYTVLEGDVMPKWLCMTLLRCTLEQRIQDNQVSLLADLTGILAGLDFIHSQGMMHRDIKPKNIMVAEDGTMQVADLGFVRAIAMLDGVVGDLTVVGTSPYVAPDIVEGAEYDPGRDVYAFGVTAVEMVLRESPATNHDARMEQVKRAMENEPSFAFVFQKCCQRLSADRPSCRALHVALSQTAFPTATSQAACLAPPERNPRHHPPAELVEANVDGDVVCVIVRLVTEAGAVVAMEIWLKAAKQSANRIMQEASAELTMAITENASKLVACEMAKGAAEFTYSRVAYEGAVCAGQAALALWTGDPFMAVGAVAQAAKVAAEKIAKLKVAMLAAEELVASHTAVTVAEDGLKKAAERADAIAAPSFATTSNQFALFGAVTEFVWYTCVYDPFRGVKQLKVRAANAAIGTLGEVAGAGFAVAATRLVIPDCPYPFAVGFVGRWAGRWIGRALVARAQYTPM